MARHVSADQWQRRKVIEAKTLQKAITSGEFLDFDKVMGTPTVGALQQALFQLDGQIDRLRNIIPKGCVEGGMTLFSDQSIKNNRKAEFSLKNERFVMPFVVHDLIDNAINLCRAIHLALERG